MNPIKHLLLRKLLPTTGRKLAALAACFYAVACTLVANADPKSSETKPAATNSVAAPLTNSAKAAPHKLTGAELYSIHCARCHPERYPTERTAAQWKTILTHMRIRANLPAEQARTILKYLQENSGR